MATGGDTGGTLILQKDVDARSID